MSCDWNQVKFGETGLSMAPLGLGSSYGVSTNDLERAFERGLNFFFWGSRRRSGFGKGVRTLARKHRDTMVIAMQSYARLGSLMGPFLDKGLRELGIEHVDLLTLSWWNDVPPQRILDAASALKASGKVRHVMVSCHHRPTFEKLVELPSIEAIMVRYNAAHPGAEREVFPHLGPRNPGVLAFTATRWGSLLDPKLTPPGEPTPRASDCYRFALSHPNVHACLAGPKDGVELDEAMAALDRGPMSDDELAWMRRVGKVVRGDASANVPIRTLDKVRTALFGARA